MYDETSVERQLRREAAYVPPYCPKRTCRNHFKEKARAHFSRRHGFVALKRFPYAAQRFQCRDCLTTFSASIFRLYYRQKRWGHNEEIWRDSQDNVCKRATARRLGVSEKLVRIRLRNMSRWAELLHAKFTEEIKIEEPIVYDGIENFSYSQYDPNNINHAVGKESLFVYDFNFSPLNRKGRMSGRQKGRKRQLEKRHGPYPRQHIRSATKRIFERLLKKTKAELVIYSDRHFQYRKVVEEDLSRAAIRHITVSSKIYRNFRNDLFAINNIDAQVRHNLSAFKRETIAFSKHEIAMQDVFILHVAYRNYMRPKFWKAHRRDPESNRKSPAMQLGLTKSILTFSEFFGERVLPSQVKLHEDALARYERRQPYSRRVIAPAPRF